MRYSTQVKPISYLKANAAEVLDKLAENRQPLIITQNGEARAVIQDLATYENTQETLALLKILALGQQQIADGKVSVAIGRKVVEKIGPGGVFGEMALVDHSPRTAAAIARADCNLLAIDRAELIEFVKSEPAMGMQMMRSVATRIRYMNDLLA